MAPTQLVGYLYAMKAAMWFEKTSGIAEWETLTSSPMMQTVASELTRRTETEATRIGAWLKLLKTWASLRFDDLANIKLENLKFYDGKLAGILRKTKTTGAGKRVRELLIFVSEEAYLHRKQWWTWSQLLGSENTLTELVETEEVLSPCESSEPTDLEPEPMKRRRMSRLDSERHHHLGLWFSATREQ